MTLTNKKTISVTIGGKSIGGITEFLSKTGKETILVPSTTIPGAFVYTEQNIHILTITRRIFNLNDFSDIHNLTNFDVVTVHGTRTVRYSGCEIKDISEYYCDDGTCREVINISVGNRTVV